MNKEIHVEPAKLYFSHRWNLQTVSVAPVAPAKWSVSSLFQNLATNLIKNLAKNLRAVGARGTFSSVASMYSTRGVARKAYRIVWKK